MEDTVWMALVWFKYEYLRLRKIEFILVNSTASVYIIIF
jgi:hypothetical protein